MERMSLKVTDTDTDFLIALRAFMRSFGWTMFSHDLFQEGWHVYEFMKEKNEPYKYH